MHIKVQRNELLESLSRMPSIADKNSVMQILSNVLLRVNSDEKKLEVAATDLYHSMRSECMISELEKSGDITVSAHDLFNIVKNLPNKEVTLEVTDTNSLKINTGRIKFNILGMSGIDFPEIPGPEHKYICADVWLIRDLIELTQYAVCTDETRPHIAGAFFECENKKVRMVATNGHMLCKVKYNLDKKSELNKFDCKAIIPNKGLSELKALIDKTKTDSMNIWISLSGRNMFFKHGNNTLSIRITDETFPPYNKVIPDRVEYSFTVEREHLINSLKRISIVAKEKLGIVRFVIKDKKVMLCSENPEIGNGDEIIEVDSNNMVGLESEIGFNARYLLDILSALNEDMVILEFTSDSDPVVIRPISARDFKGVVMPVRI